MNRKEFFKVSAAASLASLLSPLSAYAEKFESEDKKVNNPKVVGSNPAPAI